MKRYSHNRGFTIIEMLVVVAIIAILAGIITTNLTSSRSKARDAKRISDLGNIQLALELYFDRCRQYPTTLSVENGVGCPSSITLGSYIATIPTPPTGAGQASYGYGTLVDASSKIMDYVLYAKLENTNSVVKDGLSAVPSTAPPGYSWNNTSSIQCSNSDTSLNYCITSK